MAELAAGFDPVANDPTRTFSCVHLTTSNRPVLPATMNEG
jgi:hypothetical protein